MSAIKRCETCGVEMPDAHGRRKFCSEKCRKMQYSIPCVDCGKPLDGSNGRGPNAPERCLPCTAIHNRKWTEERIIDAMHEFERRYGYPPTSVDWNPAHARNNCYGHIADKIAKRFDPDVFPSSAVVQGRFGSWNAAMEAAGYVPRGYGQWETERRAAVA